MNLWTRFLWQSGTKYRLNVHDADMNVVESVYGQTEQGTTVIEGSLFVKGKSQLLHEQVMGSVK